MNIMRNIFLLLPIMLSTQFSYSALSVQHQQGPQRASLGQANNNNDILSEMQPITDPLDNALQKGILRNCPHEIESIITRWGAHQKRPLSRNKKAYLFYGPYGSGKLMAIKAIAQECGLTLFMYEAFLMPRSDRIQLLQQIFEKAAALKSPCLLSIRHLEAFTNDNGGQTPEMIYLLSLLDAYKEFPILFIGTMQDKSRMPYSLVSALHHKVSVFSPLGVNQRKELISFYMRKFYRGGDNENLAQELAEKTDGYMYHGLKGLVQNAKTNYRMRTKHGSGYPQREDFLDELNEIEARKKTKQTAWEMFLAKAKKWAIPAAIVCAVACGFFLGYKYLKRNPLLRKI